MARISRTAPVTPANDTQEQRSRFRLRRSPSLGIGAEEAERRKKLEVELDEQLKLISKNDDAIDEAVANNEKAYARVTELLKAGKMPGFTNGRYEAKLVIPMGKTQRTVRVADYRKKVTQAQFEASITIPVAEAKKYLSEEELKKVCDVVDAKPGNETLKVEKITVKTTRVKG